MPQMIRRDANEITEPSTPLPTPPQGYVVSNVRTVTPKVLPGTRFIPGVGYVSAEKAKPYIEYTYKRVTPEYISYGSPGLFGLTIVEPYKDAPKVMQEKAKVVDVINPEAKAATGLGLATVVGVGAAVPLLGAASVVGVSGAEAVKVGVTGKHLTVEEAVAVAGVSQFAVAVGASSARAFKPTVQRSIEGSYRSAVEAGELWKPTTLQKIGMKVTGASTPRLAQELVGAGEAPPLSFKMLSQKTLGAPEESYFWDTPTPRSSQLYRAGAVGSRAKLWASEHLIKHVSGGLSYALVQEELARSGVKASMPYVPSEPTVTLKTAISYPLVGAGAVAGLQMITETKPKSVAVTSQRLEQMAMPVQRQTQRQRLIQKSGESTLVNQVLDLEQEQQQSQRQILTQTPVQQVTQTQSQITKQVTEQTSLTSLVMSGKTQVLKSGFGGFDFPLGFQRVSSSMIGGYGRYKRRYPIKTASQLFKEMWK